MAQIKDAELEIVREIVGKDKTAQVCPAKGGGVRIMIVSHKTVSNSAKDDVDKGHKVC